MNDGMTKKLVGTNDTPEVCVVDVLLLRTEFLQNHMKGRWPGASLFIPLSMPNAFGIATTRINDHTISCKLKGRPGRVLAAHISVNMQWG